MHELAITKSFIELIRSECRQRKIKPRTVIAELGGMTSFKKDAVLFYFDLLKKEYPDMEQIHCVINEIPGRIACNACCQQSGVEDPCFLFCPLCGSRDVEIIQGKKFILKEMKVN